MTAACIGPVAAPPVVPSSFAAGDAGPDLLHDHKHSNAAYQTSNHHTLIPKRKLPFSFPFRSSSGTGKRDKGAGEEQQQQQQQQAQPQQDFTHTDGDQRLAQQQTEQVDLHPASNMGKSNKFDCTNRRNEGVELGKSIGDAALKELEKSKKDATRIASKARKSSTGSLTDNDTIGVHFIDLIVPSKALTDDGVVSMVEGLHGAMSRGTSQASIALEGINLRDNKLTTRGLATLARVIDLAQNELKTVVLSDNNISVTTDEEAQQWETFLVSFKSCKTLRRLDLSGNVELGSRAMEIFSRIHCNEPAIDPIALGGDRSVFTLDEAQEDDDAKSMTSDTGLSGDEGFDTMTAGVFLMRRSGLRSIPYIALSNIGLNDTGALWLSYVLEDHYFPNQLINEINAAPATSSVDAYQQDATEGGIDWHGNESTLGKDGLIVLKKTESVRKQAVHDDSSSQPTGSPETMSIRSIQARRSSRVSVSTRRSSVRSLHTDDGGEHEVSDLESIRMRMQRHMIENRGICSVNLWDAALSMILLSRKLSYITAPFTSRQQYSGPCLFVGADSAAGSSDAKTERLDSAASITDTGESTTSTDDGIPSSAATTINRTTGKSYAATLSASTTLTSGVPENVITEVTNTPNTPRRIFKPHRKGAFSEGSDLQGLSERLASVDLEQADHRPERFLEYQQARQARQGLQYRDATATCQLPQSIFNRILAFALSSPDSSKNWTFGPEDEVVQNHNGDLLNWPGRALLSERQQRQTYEWGQRSETLVVEREWAHMIGSSQRWMLMDRVGCLVYEADK
ncbi:hypothetical protein Q7P37_007785 [Cladosporium fusiforme]